MQARACGVVAVEVVQRRHPATARRSRRPPHRYQYQGQHRFGAGLRKPSMMFSATSATINLVYQPQSHHTIHIMHIT